MTSSVSNGESYAVVGGEAVGTQGSFQGIGAEGTIASASAYGYSTTRSTTAYRGAGGGGAGYGAGGGGGYAYAAGYYAYTVHAALNGGGAGQLKQSGFRVGIDFDESIPVTVGAGGARQTFSASGSGGSSGSITYGKGADGCVAIFW